MAGESGMFQVAFTTTAPNDHSWRTRHAGSIHLSLLLMAVCLSVFVMAGSALGNDDKKYLADLRSADVTVRIKAATELGRSHSIDGVKVALKDPDKRVREAAVTNLSIHVPQRLQQRDPLAVAIFIESLKDADKEVRYAALYQLRDYEIEASFGHFDTDPDICREISRMFRDPAEHIRFQAILMAENCRTEESENSLLRIAHDRAEPVRIRRVAIMRLGNSRTKGMADRIMPFLKQTEEKEIRTGAIYSLGKLKHSAAVSLIVPYVYDKDSEARHTAIIALGMIGDPKGADALADVLITKDGKIEDFALNSLRKAGSASAIPKLVKVKPLLKNSGARAQYIEALTATKSDTAVPYLLELFGDKDFAAEQHLVARGLESFESDAALKSIIAAAKNNPHDTSLAALAETANRKLSFPEEAAKKKQDQKEESAVQAREQEINRIFAIGARLFQEKRYEKAIPFYYDAVDQFEKLYAAYPAHFRSSSNQIRTIRSTLAEYYLWNLKDAGKAATEYENLISILKVHEKDTRAIIPYSFAVGEIYEKDLKDYRKAFNAYNAAAVLLANKDKQDPEMEMLGSWYLDWIAFLAEKISVQQLKEQEFFSRRTLKYPNYGYGLFMSLGGSSFGSSGSLDQDDLFMTGEDQVSKELFDKLSARYPGRYRSLLLGAGLFQEFVRQDKYADAEYVAKKLIRLYPDDLNTVMLQLDLAYLYKRRSNNGEYKQHLALAHEAAQQLNVKLVLGPDDRFATPEKTWKLFMESLKNGDLDKAIECFSPISQQRYKEILSALKANLSRIAADMGKIRKIKDPQDGRAEYYILKKENGDEYSHGISFVDIYGEWKIEQF